MLLLEFHALCTVSASPAAVPEDERRDDFSRDAFERDEFPRDEFRREDRFGGDR